MTTPSPLTLDMLEWLAAGPQPYGEVMEAWRTSCPRLSIWEDALEAGLVARGAGHAAPVAVTTQGRACLARAGRA